MHAHVYGQFDYICCITPSPLEKHNTTQISRQSFSLATYMYISQVGFKQTTHHVLHVHVRCIIHVPLPNGATQEARLFSCTSLYLHYTYMYITKPVCIWFHLLFFTICEVKVHRVHSGECEANKGQGSSREAPLSSLQLRGGELVLSGVTSGLKLVKVGGIIWCAHTGDVGWHVCKWEESKHTQFRVLYREEGDIPRAPPAYTYSIYVAIYTQSGKPGDKGN